MQTVQVAPKAYFDADDFGKNYKIAPMTNYNATNVKSCFLANGTKDNPADVQSVLPDMAGFSVCTTVFILISVVCQCILSGP